MDDLEHYYLVLAPSRLISLSLPTSFSNRCFWTKAISIWTSTGDADHAWIVGSYFHYAGGYEPPIVRQHLLPIIFFSVVIIIF